MFIEIPSVVIIMIFLIIIIIFSFNCDFFGLIIMIFYCLFHFIIGIKSFLVIL